MKKAIVLGAGGFIGSHLVKRLKAHSYWVRGVDIKYPEFSPGVADEFLLGDLRDRSTCQRALAMADANTEVYQLAADMGGAGYLFTGMHDADVVHNSALINLNIAQLAAQTPIRRLFFSSSACIYPKHNQQDPDHPQCPESSAYPADPDSEYGWEKLFSERLYDSYRRNYGLDIRVARFHNVYGPEGTWMGGREKAPAALCRKVALAEDGGAVELWGDGLQTRSFLFIDDCIDGILALVHGDYTAPLNIGSEEMISIADFARLIIEISGKQLSLKHIPGPEGVRGRNSDNTLITKHLGWSPQWPLREGIAQTYTWIDEQLVSYQRLNGTVAMQQI
ncbi:MAG: NAD-dependent dehydratase [Bacteroidetes bacterium]|nr:MAG: NAD-dependent dehydratase [Bacteroidota bacterium]PTM12426.1 MAG: NAD-dependent dehydratase [Bacteroidota bacterium]